MAVASTVTVNITAETAKFDNGLKKAKGSAKGFSNAIGQAFKIATVATAVLGGALARLTQQSLATVDTQVKAARVLGTTQKVFAGLSLAAGIAGVSVESFTKALKKQEKAIVDANDGLLTQKRAFDRLGLSAKDLLQLPVEDQFKKITSELNKVENQTLKVAIASDIFGAKNIDLLNILELGADGLDFYIKKVDELGVALTSGQTKAIEDANDAVLVLKTAMSGLGNQLASQFAPALKRAAEALTKFVSSITSSVETIAINVRRLLGLQKDLNVLSLAGLQQEYRNTQNAIFDLKTEVEAANAIISAPPKGPRGGALIAKAQTDVEKYKGRLEELAAELEKNIALQKELLNPPKPEAGLGDGDDLTGAMDADNALKRFQAAVAATRTPLEQLQAKIAEIRNDLTTHDFWEPEVAQRQAQQAVDAYIGELNRVKAASDAIIDQQRKDFEAAAAAVATPSERLQSELNKIRENLTNNPRWTPEVAGRQAQVAVDAYIAEMKRIEDANNDIFQNMTEFQREAFRNMQDILSDSLFNFFEDGTKGMLKNFVDMLRKMVAQLLATKILEYFFGLFGGGSGIGGGIFGGGGTTKSTGFTGFAIGGQIRAGQTGRVSEGGKAELFTPGASGAIRPLGSVTINQENNFSGGNLNASTLIPILEDNNKRLKAELLDEIDRGAFA